MARPKKEQPPVPPIVSSRIRAVPALRPAPVYNASDNVYLVYIKNGNKIWMSRKMAERMVKTGSKNYYIQNG